MVAIVSGNSLGLSLGSQATLGQRGQTGTAGQGRSGEQAYVNAATGNLVLQTRDELLLGRGPDTVSLRTYNSQGQLSDDNADNWAVGAFGQRMLLTGTVATAGSTLTRTDRDGAQAVYTWDAARSLYVSTAGAGAFDTIAHDAGASQFVWTDGDSGLTERYQATGQGRLVSATDASGNTVSYAYNANGTVQSATDANGDVTYYDYSGTNLTQIRTVTAGGATSTRVRYAYDGSNRLSTVTVDLSPDDNIVADGNTYVTTYTYDGASKRVASVSQSDGTSLAFTYVQADGVYKVQSVTDALGAVITFAYNTAAGTTTVTDALGAAAVYLYDAQGQLVQVRQGVTAGNAAGLSQVSYVYDAAGNVTLVTDGEGNKVALTYDERGNLLKEVDSAGNTRTRTYSAANQLLTDTLYADAATSRGAFSKEAALPETVRYVYAQNNPYQLRFVVSAQGNVTEYSYDANGLRTSAVEYAGAPYDTVPLAQTAVPTEAQLATWRQGQDLTRSQRTDYAYDGRGALQTATTYGAVNASGQGDAATAATTQYIYDPRGLLLQKIEPGAAGGVSHYVYDGLDRVLSVSGPSLDGGATANVTVTSYDDANARTTVTLASGLVTISAYDRAGRLVIVTQTSVGTGVLGTTTYAYDKDGNLLMTQDPTGVRKWMLYDAADRKIADIDAAGAVIEYVYNANGQLRQTIAYATPIGTAALVDGAGKPTTAWGATNTTTSIDAIRPAATAQDQKVWRFYDTANRLTWQVDALGYVTQTTYDGASRVLSVTQLANPIDVTQLGNGANIELLIDPTTVGGVTLGALGAPVPLGTAVTLTASVAGSSPGGMVTFFVGNTIIGSASVIGGVARLTTNELPVGTNSIRAAYSGDMTRPAAISAAGTMVVAGATTSVGLSFSPNYGATYGQSVTLSTWLTTSQPPGLAPATGEVKFYSGTTLLGTSTVINGQALLSVSNLPVGTSSIRVEYSGDAKHAAATQTSSLLIAAAPTTTTLQVSAGGDGMQLSAMVASNAGLPAPTGTVTFYSGNTTIGTATLVNGVAILQYSGTAPAAAFRAVYAGDVNNATSNTSGTSSTTPPSPTSVTLSASATSVTQGQPVTLTATVAGAAPGGAVTFFAGTQLLGTASVVNGQATFVTNYLPVGASVVLSAAYTGDANNAGSVLAQGPSLQVAAGSGAVTAPSVQANSMSITPFGTVMVGFPAQTGVSPTNGPATGNYPGVFSVFDGQTLIASYMIPQDGRGSYIYLPAMSLGTHNLTVVYSGDALRGASMGTHQLLVNPVSSKVEVLSSRAQTTAGAPLTLTARIGADPIGQGTSSFSGPVATGTVTFYSNGVAIGTANVVNGVATLSTSDLALGSDKITATYSGDANYKVATSGSLSQQVVASTQVASTTTVLTTASPTGRVGSPLTLTATVTPSAGALASPSGSVSFYNGNQLLGTVALLNGKASLSTSQLTLGMDALSAVYSGDTSAATSAATLYLPVAQATTTTTLSASATSVTQGQPVTLTATVAGAAPGGAVTFFAGTQLLGTASVVNGQATFVTNYLPVGASVVLSAAYTGDANNAGSVLAQGPSLQVAAGSGAVTAPSVQANSMSITPFGTVMVGFPAQTGVSPTNGPATGNYPGVFSVFDGQTLIASYMIPQDGRGSYIYLPAMSLGTHNLTVVYSGDALRGASMGTHQLLVNPVSSKVEVLSSRAQTTAGAPLTLTARIGADPIGQGTSSFSGPVATGTVTFYSNGVAIGTANVVNGIATFTTSNLASGTANITASYSGDANYKVATSGSLSQQVVASPVTSYVSLTTTPAAPVYGAPLTLTAIPTGQGNPEGGSVSFYDGAVLLGTVNLVGGKASLSVSNLEVGGHSIKAVYSGDANNATSTSNTYQTVAKAPAALTNLTAASIAKDGSLSVQVGGVAPGGLVSFYQGMRLLGTAQVVNGVATLSGVALPPGTHSFTAAYAGDAHYLDGEVSFTQVVQGTPITTIYAALDIQQDRTVTELYNRDGRLQGTLDAEGYLTEYKYNAAGELVQTIRYANRAANFTSVSARIAAVAIARASYNLSGLRPGTNSSADIHTHNLYDAQGRLVGQVDGEGYLTETIYDARGNVTQIIRRANPAGAVNGTSTLDSIRPTADAARDQVTVQTWSAANQLLTRTNAEGTVTQFAYDSVGQLVQTTTAVGTTDERTSRLRYDIQGRLIGELDGRGSDAVVLTDPFALWAANGLTHAYDAAGRRTSTTDANGHRTLFFYDPIGRLAYTVNALGEVTESRYNALGQLAEEVVYGTRVNVATLGATTPGGLNTATLAGQLAAVADATKDTHVLHSYNATGTRASTTDALGSATSYSYNAFREATATSYALKSGYVVTNTSAFDRRGLNTQTVRDALGAKVVQSRSYDAFGRLTGVIGDGHYDQFGYDRAGRLIYTSDFSGRVRQMTYDGFDRVLTQKDWYNNTTSFYYNTANRSVTVITPESVTMTTVHNRFGQTQSVTDGRGNTTSYSYDKSGNLLQTAAALDATTTVATGSTYDKTGLVLTSTDANGVVTSYAYDAANRLLTRAVDPTGLNLVTTYGYDAKGQTVSVTDPGGTVTSTAYDLNGQVVRQTVDPAGLNLQTVYTHDTNGTTLTVTSPGGTLTRYTYDGAGRRIKEQVDPDGLNITRQYAYDGQNRVIRAVDANGNVTRYFYGGTDALLYTVDPLGNSTENTYDHEGRVIRTTTYATPINIAGLTDASTSVDVQTRINYNGDKTTQSRRYDRDGRLHFSVDGTGAVIEYKYDKSNNVIETRAYANRINLAVWNLISDPVATADAARDERVRTVYDALNRATWKVDGAGNVVQYFHDANGNVTESRAYATALTSAALGNWNGTSAPPVAADATRDQRTRSVYDTANRATWNVDALGSVTQYTYDANGNIVAQRRYATPLTAAALAVWDGRTAPAPVADDAHDARVRHVYDAANRLTWSVDGIGAVSKTEYDANGNVTRRASYLNPVGEGADPAQVIASDEDRVTDYLYDGANRLRYELRYTHTSDLASGVGEMRQVTSYDYDGVGRLVRQTAHAWPLFSYVGNDIDAVFGNLTVAPDIDQSQYMAYDAAGRLTWRVDGVGAVTRNTYDGTGRVVRTVQYARSIDVLGFSGAANGYDLPHLSESALLTAVQPDAGADRVSVFAYDGAGHRTFAVDGLGGVTRVVYDAFGNVTQQIGYANPIAVPTAATAYTDAALQGAVLANADADRIQRFAYDLANRQVFAVDAQGAVTESIYDGLGQIVQSRGFAQAINVAGLSTTASVSDIRSRTAVDAANDRVSSHVFNAGGQKIYSVDSLGFVSKTDYDGLGQVRGTLHYALSIPAGTASTAAAIAAAVVTSAEDRSKSFQYDAAGRVLSSVDPMGFTESWTYDALDNKTSYTNAKGSVWQYEYDRSGRMLREISPQVELTAVTVGSDGRLQVNAGSSGVGNVITVLVYDSFGNLRSRTEGAGRPEQRTTTYEYDQVGRQVKVIYPPVSVYNPSADTFAVDGLDSRHDTVQTLYTETTYDALGNAIANRDIGGNYSYKTYDLVGRVAHEVDALGFVTGYTRNTFGDATVLTRYAVATGLAAGHPASLGRAQVQATVDALVHDADRTLSTTYDRLGRGIEVREAAAYVHEGGGNTAQDTFAGKTTRNTYNTFGELTQVAQLKSAGTWTLSTNFYDRRGQQIASVDAMGYLTTQAFDAAGNATMRIEYAKAVSWAGTSSLAGWTGAVNAGGTPPAPVVDANNDRRVDTTYDRNNRKTSEIRRNVEYSAASNGTSARGDLTTSYGYDAVGNLTRTTDAKGASTYSYYDALGRVTAVAEPTRAGSDGATPVTPLTVFRRDAYGNVVMKTEYVNGADANGAPLAPSPLPPYALVTNPEVGLIEGNPLWAKEGSVGYIASAPFEGGTALYRINNTFFGKHLYTTSLSEYQSWLAMPNNVGEGIQGYVATAPQPGSVRLYRLTSAQPGFVDVVYTTSLAEVEALTSNAQFPYVVDEGQPAYIGGSAAGPFDAQLTRYVGPSLSFMTGFDHLYLPDRKPVDAWSDADTLATTDRTSYAQYDALGHTVQSTDAMGVNHFSSYNSLGLIAKEWQGVTDNAGTVRTLYRAYDYDALGQQTHIYDPGTSTDSTDYTQGAAATNGIYTTRPRAVVTPGAYGSGEGEGGNPVPSPDGNAPPIATYGSVALSHLANLVNAAGGAVQVQFDFITPSYDVAGTENTEPSTVPGHAASYSRTFSAPGEVLRPDGVTVSPDNEPIASVTAIRILQWNGAAWVTLWQGSPAEATGQDTLNAGAGVSGAKVDTALEYNAFGELTAKRVNGQLGEYFDYDRAGRLWRTNAGDGVDKIALYDLQGRQTADIRSAGLGRGDINLRNAADAQQVAQLSDVRRTDTTYDLIGHILSQALPERQEVQGGVSVRTDALVGGIAARAVHGSEGWSGSNTVNLGWNALGGLGSGDVRVDLYYIPIDAQGNEGPEQVRSQTLNATQGSGGASFSWNPAAGEGYGGIGRISRVVVAKKDLQANWQTLISQNGVGYTGQSLQVASPDDPNAWVQVQYRLAGSNGAWSELSTVRFGDAARGDLSGLALGRYEYQAITHAPGQSDRTTSMGVFEITPRPLATFGVAGVNGSAQTLDWQGPGAGDLQTIRVRPVGGSWSAPWGINRAAGSDWSTINLSGLGAGQYEYEILWTHPGEAGPYAHATGQINKVDGTPGTPGTPPTPAQGLPHIDGLYVESRQEQIGSDEQTGPIYQTVFVVRVPGPPPGSISSFGVRIKGSGSGLLPLEIRQRSDLGWEVNITNAHLSAGLYEYSYGFFPGIGAAATAHALGDLALNGAGNVSITDTTPPYVPATPGTPGTPPTPPQYGWGATDMGPYPISQDPLLGGRVIGQSAGLNGLDGYQRPLVKQTIDRWGNVLSINDPRSTIWVTNYSYNANNQMVRQVQTDADGNPGVDANGNIGNANAPVTQIYYDAMGRQVAVRDANGNVNGQEWDAGGNLVRELHADGNGVDTGVVRHAYNAFGNKVRTVDAKNYATAFVFDKLDRQMRTTFESVGISQSQRWDQAGRLLSQTNGAGETVRYDYDLRGNLIKTTQPLGQSTRTGYDAFNRKVVEMDGNGALATWKYDYFGQLQGHSDIGGANYAYSYDNARQLIAQSNSRGQNRVYGYDAAGQQTRIQDIAIGQSSSYRYDLSGRRVRETTVQGNITYQDNHIAYDALGRMRWVSDARAVLTIDYDKVGNRTHIHTHVNDADVSTLPPDSDRYFQYDAMNRQTLVDSATADGSYLGPDGHRLTYDYNGLRTSDKHEGIRIVQQGDGQWAAQAGGETEEVYGYDGMNRLTSTTRDATVVDLRSYDGASRVLASGVGGLDPQYTALHTQYQGVTGSDPLQVRQSQYDDNGRLVYQSTLAHVSPLVSPSGQSFSGVSYTYDDAGNVLGYLTANADPANPTFVTTTNTVQRAEGYRQLTSFSQTRSATSGTVTAQGLVGYNYDANGFLTHTGDPGNQSVTQNHFFVNDANGTALYAYYGDPANPTQGQRQLVVNGEVLGRYGWVPDELYAGVSFPVPGFTPYTQKASFSLGYQPINGNYPAGTPGTYAVGAGDTLQSIAKGAYGDANLWYLIADANGLGGNAEMRVGQVLTIPAHVSNANNSATFKPYDPSKMMEGTSPTMMAMPQGQDGGCGAVGQIIMVVVAVVVTIWTAGAAAPYLGATVGGATTMGAGLTALAGGYGAGVAVAAGAIGGAVGSIASQGVGVAIGAQDQFSWKGVALGAIGGGISGGLGAVASGGVGALSGLSGPGLGVTMARAAIGNALTQGIGVATGLQDKFDWKSVAASAVSAGVGQGLNSAMGYNPSLTGFEFGKSLVSGVGASIVGQAVRGGKVSAATLATDAFGNIVSDAIAGANSSIPGPVSANERSRIMGYFDGSGLEGTSATGGAQGLGYGTSRYGFQASNGAVNAWSSEVDGGIVLNGSMAPNDDRVVQVRSGQTLSGLTGRNDAVYLDRVAQYNGLASRHEIDAGQSIAIPSDDVLAQVAVSSGVAKRGADGNAYYAQRQANAQAQLDAQAAQAATTVNTGGYVDYRDPRDFQGSFGYRSMVARQLSDVSTSSAGPTYADSIKPAQSGWENIVGAAGAYWNRSDVSLSQAASAAWNGGGNDLLAGVGHSLGAATAAVGAAFASPTVLGTVGLSILSAQQTDAAVADYRRFFGSGDERGAQSLLTQGLTPLIGTGGVAYVNAGVDFAYGVGVTGSGLSRAESRVLGNTTYRSLNANDAQTWEAGQGLVAKAPNGPWTAEQHVLNAGPQPGGSMLNDPWISSSWSYDLANTGYNTGNGLVSINLGRVPTEQVQVWQNVARSNAVDSLAYHRSIWAQEVTIYQNIPPRAIGTPFAPMSQVPVYGPISYGLAIGGNVFNGRQGSQR